MKIELANEYGDEVEIDTYNIKGISKATHNPRIHSYNIHTIIYFEKDHNGFAPNPFECSMFFNEVLARIVEAK